MRNLKEKIALFIFFAVLLFVSANKVDAQKGEFGLRFMPTVSSLDINTSSGGTVKGEATLGYGFGAFLGFNFTDHFGIQGEVIYNTTSQKYQELDVERKITLKYINIPLLLSYNTGKANFVNFNIVAGPQIGISAGSSLLTTGGNGNEPPEAVLSVKKGDLGVAYGAGLDFGLNEARNIRLGLGFRGVYGLFDISDNSKTSANDGYYVLDRTHIETYSGYVGMSILF